MSKPHGKREKGSRPSSAGPGACGTLVRGMASPDRVTRTSSRSRVARRFGREQREQRPAGARSPAGPAGALRQRSTSSSSSRPRSRRPRSPPRVRRSARRSASRCPRTDVRGHGSAVAAADDALAHIVLEASGRPLVVANVDLSEARVGGLGTDLVASFLHELAEGGGLTLHVRLIDGDDPQHVLEAIFKALGVALAQAGRPRKRRD